MALLLVQKKNPPPKFSQPGRHHGLGTDYDGSNQRSLENHLLTHESYPAPKWICHICRYVAVSIHIHIHIGIEISTVFVLAYSINS